MSSLRDANIQIFIYNMKLTVQQIVQQMVSAGVHFGHRRCLRNPKMIPYIYTEKDDLQIIDLLQTYWYLQIASKFLFDACRRGKRILFVGTKKYIAKCVEQTANECHSWYINKRWLGGLLTNWGTMQKSILKLQTENRKAFVPRDERQAKDLDIQNAFSKKSKKENTRFERRKKRLLKYFGGVQTMSELPDIVIIIGQQEEMNAVRECQKLKIPNLTILDTNCNPSFADLFIPANDDSLTSVHFILSKLANAIKKGQKDFQLQKKNGSVQIPKIGSKDNEISGQKYESKKFKYSSEIAYRNQN